MNNQRTIRFYYDLISQPCRAIFIFLQQTKIPHQKCPKALRKWEHTTTDFLRNVNRFGKVPAIVQNDNFKLAESIAILRYLAREYSVADHWYPRDSRQRARVDEYLEWQHCNTRAHCSSYVRYVWRGPLRGEPMEKRTAERLRAEMIACLDFIETNLLTEEKRFIAGGREISIADLVAACEIEQPKLTGYDARVGRPKLAAWMQRVRERTQQDYDEAHKILDKYSPKVAH
ncbi:glutathione S-transferase theta-1-like [Malaya genurostris]|uniref:glutathione S-transferase theta-1-like n=1 Tax=Malaya genurostris TaxID=325434 RepID=UPI0026F3F42F|nr:glutathione S-transferase theta-1-like [Malaya genurostris]XP_058444863.1 glutathione S-transferase theta-1-like [Malaya genurostris]